MKTPEQMAEEYADLCVSDDYYASLKAGFLAGYQAGQEHPFQFQAKMWIDPIGLQNRWISVEERLPEFCKTIVAYGPRIYCVISQLMQDEEGYSYVGPYMSVHPDEVTHWCEVPELPEAPKGEA